MTPTLSIYNSMTVTVHENSKGTWDKWGMALSGACLLHCVAVMALPLLLPTLRLFVHTPWIHRLFALFILVVTPMAFVPGYRRHGISTAMTLAYGGVALILVGVFTDGFFSELLTHGISITGSVILIAAHVQNLRHTHSNAHQKCCDHHH